LCCGSRGSLPWPTAWFKPGLPTGKYIRTGSWDRKFDQKDTQTSWKRGYDRLNIWLLHSNCLRVHVVIVQSVCKGVGELKALCTYLKV
jgi:hypothetical protein